MTGRVEGKRALVTGGARGIGRACARRLAEEGADVAVIDIATDVATVPYAGARPEQLESIAAEITRLGRRAMARIADVSKSESIDAVVAEMVTGWGGVDILVAAAGIDSWGNAWELDEPAWQRMIDVNLGGVWRAAKAVSPAMIRQNSGAMVLIGSVLSHRANKLFAHYTAAKHGVLGLARAFALELGPFMVRVNSVAPTVVPTDMVMSQAYLDMVAGHPGATVEEIRSLYLARRALPVPWVEPVDIANAVLFLASDEARYITGISLPVDLGSLLK
ncbi:MAG TPA: mycofactocin-coupled SDR family oxidoreductase [Stellaceae bacterium]|nr:mycofactocin-coupled SDR family oxidoreductase [Stellaceae bacterium]